MSRQRILIVDDDESIRFALRDFLEGRGYEVDAASTCQAALAIFGASHPDAAVLDYSLPDGTALELLPRLRQLDAAVPCLVLTAHGSIDLAVQAVKEGAEHFLTKPLELPTLAVILERALENQRARKQKLAGRSREARRAPDPFLGVSPAIRRLAEDARRVAQADSPVLIQGETGAGKGVLAAWLHRSGPRAEEAFVDLNCASLSRDLLESELFGHEKGAFTGAVAAKTGLLEVAHRGSVFLDEIGDMDVTVQPKLLKVLEERRFRRLGEVRDRQVDVRLIAATHQDLMLAVQEKRFRSDLYFRISTVPLRVPPLRERPEDIAPIAAELLRHIAADMGRGDATLASGALAQLQAYSWPGNVRELRNVLERALLLGEGRVVEARDLRFAAFSSEPTPAAGAPDAPEGGNGYDSALSLEQVERLHVERVLREEGGRIEAAARRLGVPRSSLYKRVKALGLQVPRG